MINIEYVILKNLIKNKDFMVKVIPFIKEEYFYEQQERVLFRFIAAFIEKHKVLPTYESIYIDINNSIGLSDRDVKKSIELLSTISEDNEIDINYEWLINETEQWCQTRALHNAIRYSVDILDPENTSLKDRGEIPKILSDALSVSFDSNVGHDYINDADHRYELYTKKESFIATDIDLFNKILNGGFYPKSLYLFLSSNTGTGKTLLKTHLAAQGLLQGYNVLYITLEMGEERISERIDANLLNINIKEVSKLSKTEYLYRFKKLSNNIKGKLIIKEYPPTVASVTTFRSLLNELKLKKGFVPDIIFVDYLSLMASSRIKLANSNSYSYVKSVAEELRGLAVEFNIPCVTSQQSNRSAIGNTDIDESNISESIGIAYTVDFMAALIKTDELVELNQILVKQIKNRYGSIYEPAKFCLGIDFTKMRVYNVENSAQENLSGYGIDSGPINSFGIEQNLTTKFGGFKI